MASIKLVAVDVDGTFARNDHTIDVERFKRIFDHMTKEKVQFVVASGNQYYQLRDYFPGYHEQLSFVAENGAYVKDHEEVIFAGVIERDTVLTTLDWIDAHDEVLNVMSCYSCAYIERDPGKETFFEHMGTYYHRLAWADDLRAVDDPVLKFALNVPPEKTMAYYNELRSSLSGHLEPTTSGHGAIDLIIPGNHKASGLERLAKRWGIDASECVTFGDGGNDVEMLRWAGRGYAMANASDAAKEAADAVCPSNEEQGVLSTLEELFGL